MSIISFSIDILLIKIPDSYPRNSIELSRWNLAERTTNFYWLANTTSSSRLWNRHHSKWFSSRVLQTRHSRHRKDIEVSNMGGKLRFWLLRMWWKNGNGSTIPQPTLFTHWNFWKRQSVPRQEMHELHQSFGDTWQLWDQRGTSCKFNVLQDMLIVFGNMWNL